MTAIEKFWFTLLTLVTLLAATGCSTETPAIVYVPPDSNEAACVSPCLPVFPGAKGPGTETVAGRAGQVIAVTTLAKSGAGSLRAALEVTGPRTVVFRVAGAIELDDFLYIHNPYVTVAGQTAPGDGILIKGAGLVVATHDVLIQHLRFRPGNLAPIVPEDNDAIAILGPQPSIGETGAYNVVIDHVSASWSEDEVISTWFQPHGVTVSWSIFAEGLNRSRHEKITHSAGVLISRGSDQVSFHHNLVMNNDFRNPLIQDQGTKEFSHNLVYNWGELPCEVNSPDTNTAVNFIGNVYKPGPSSAALESDSAEMRFNIPTSSTSPMIFISGNDMPALNGLINEFGAVMKFLSVSAFDIMSVGRESASTTLVSSILAAAGALPSRRDAVDARLINQYLNNQGAIIDSPTQVGGYPVIRTGAAPMDSDNDGMPDTWEQAHGHNRLIPDSRSLASDGSGYTNLEKYIHTL